MTQDSNIERWTTIICGLVVLGVLILGSSAEPVAHPIPFPPGAGRGAIGQSLLTGGVVAAVVRALNRIRKSRPLKPWRAAMVGVGILLAINTLLPFLMGMQLYLSPED